MSSTSHPTIKISSPMPNKYNRSPNILSIFHWNMPYAGAIPNVSLKNLCLVMLALKNDNTTGTFYVVYCIYLVQSIYLTIYVQVCAYIQFWYVQMAQLLICVCVLMAASSIVYYWVECLLWCGVSIVSISKHCISFNIVRCGF